MSKVKEKGGCGVSIIGILGAIFTANIGQTIHGTFFWGLVDFFFWPLVWIKWLLYRDVNVSIIKESFEWFLQ